jgi:hypothetical protein
MKCVHMQVKAKVKKMPVNGHVQQDTRTSRDGGGRLEKTKGKRNRPVSDDSTYADVSKV